MEAWMTPYAWLFLIAFAVAYVTTPLARKIAWRVDAVDYPGKRRINRKPIPRMGGIAVFAGVAVAIAIQWFGSIHLGWPSDIEPSPHLHVNYWAIVLACITIFVTGLIDDKYSLKPKQKLLGQLAAAIIAVCGGLVIGVIVNPFTNELIDLGWFAYPLTVIYLVAYSNIINLIDGLDGLATGISCISSITMFALSMMAGRYDAATLSIAVAGATLAFLRYNFNPASIFLGDSGALFLGFALGTVSLLSVTRIAGLTTIIVPLVIAGIPIIDTFSAIVRRSRAHVSIGHADRGHIHHRLMEEGFDQRQAVLLIYAWTALLCVGSFAMTQVSVWPRIFIFIILVLSSTFFAINLKLFQPVLLHHRNPETGDDELVGPQHPAFKAEEAKFEEEHQGLPHIP
ncbi:MAG: undecaprenyl/decaprenyl-phosphate alpha-N-acetylglucosaminyl 1-phosphate transferase [Atopobiaceae bacterium]|nr:undecaprenyl/decaprenyl-phosphate alpha-N-acetylglucosaminyl 1-phosphate transferase [Atopobiaceae bacterium]